MNIKIRRVNQGAFCIYLILFIVLVSGILKSFTDFFSIIPYSIDFINVFLFFLLIKSKVLLILKKKKSLMEIRWIFVFFVSAVISTLPRINSIFLFLIALRNNFSYYIFFISCICFLKKEKLVFLDIAYWINFSVIIIQFFGFGIKQDWLGGIFGSIGGEVNGALNVFLVIYTIKIIVMYLNKQNTLNNVIITSLVSLFIASLAELKFFYLEYVIIIAISSLVTSFSWRKILIIVGCLIGFIVGAKLLFIIYPGLDRRFFSFEFLYAYSTSDQGYTSAGDINRLNFIKQCNDILKSGIYIMFGLGLGNCEIFNPLGLISNFYKTYGFLHYTWFSSSFIYLELGIVGTILYFGFFIWTFFQIRRREKYSNDLSNCQMAEILALMAILFSIYDSSMRSSVSYLVYYILALPFASLNENFHIKRKD